MAPSVPFFCVSISLLLISCSNAYLILPSEKHVASFIFGDSLFDPGNNNYVNTTAKANFWPYGETFFQYPTGRFSNGRIIPDFIAEYAKLPLIPPYLHPANYDITYGVNFASGGAGALVETNQGLVISLNAQLGYFRTVEKQLRRKLGGEKAEEMLSKAVYSISIGTNDLSHFIMDTDLHSYSKQEYVGIVLGNLTTAIKEIYDRGGRKFGLINVLTLGCIPSMRELQGKGACLEKAGSVARHYNKQLSKALRVMERQLEGFKYSLHDFYSSMEQRINNPSMYGFKEAKSACCGSGLYRANNSCGGKRGVTEYETCQNVNEYIFFDSPHPTDKMYGQISELMWSGTPNMTGPYNLRTLYLE